MADEKQFLILSERI